MSKKFKHLYWIIPLVVILACTAAFGCYVFAQTKPAEPAALNAAQQAYYENILEQKYPETLTSSLPYPVTEAKLFLYAKAGIVIDASNGCVLFAKNADEIIPPASMTKIAVMYVVFQAIANGETTLDTVVELVPESWAKNAPLQSSVMGLAENQPNPFHQPLAGEFRTVIDFHQQAIHQPLAGNLRFHTILHKIDAYYGCSIPRIR